MRTAEDSLLPPTDPQLLTHANTNAQSNYFQELFHGEKAETGYHTVSFIPPQLKQMPLICSPSSVFDLLKMPVRCF